MMEEKQAFYVESTDGRKFKMVIRGDLGKLSVAKIRRYLKSYNVPDTQEILAGNLVLEDDMLGEHFGLQNEGVLHLRDSIPYSSPQKQVQPQPQLQLQPQPRPVPSESTASPSGWSGGGAGLYGSQPQEQGRGDYAAPPHDTNNSNSPTNMAAVQQQLRAVQRSLDAATARNEELEAQLAQARKSPASGASRTATTATGDGLTYAKTSLALLAERLHTSLQFDSNMTCVVGTDADFSLFLTYDPATERLYLYSTLLTELPAEPTMRTKLYEVLLEGALLGREVCGGGIGVSTKNNVVVLTTSLPATHCEPSALCDVMPAFVETLGRWRTLVNELLS